MRQMKNNENSFKAGKLRAILDQKVVEGKFVWVCTFKARYFKNFKKMRKTYFQGSYLLVENNPDFLLAVL